MYRYISIVYIYMHICVLFNVIPKNILNTHFHSLLVHTKKDTWDSLTTLDTLASVITSGKKPVAEYRMWPQFVNSKLV